MARKVVCQCGRTVEIPSDAADGEVTCSCGVLLGAEVGEDEPGADEAFSTHSSPKVREDTPTGRCESRVGTGGFLDIPLVAGLLPYAIKAALLFAAALLVTLFLRPWVWDDEQSRPLREIGPLTFAIGVLLTYLGSAIRGRTPKEGRFADPRWWISLPVLVIGWVLLIPFALLWLMVFLRFLYVGGVRKLHLDPGLVAVVTLFVAAAAIGLPLASARRKAIARSISEHEARALAPVISALTHLRLCAAVVAHVVMFPLLLYMLIASKWQAMALYALLYACAVAYVLGIMVAGRSGSLQVDSRYRRMAELSRAMSGTPTYMPDLPGGCLGYIVALLMLPFFRGSGVLVWLGKQPRFLTPGELRFKGTVIMLLAGITVVPTLISNHAGRPPTRSAASTPQRAPSPYKPGPTQAPPQQAESPKSGLFEIKIIRAVGFPGFTAIRVRQTSREFTGPWCPSKEVLSSSYLTDGSGTVYPVDLGRCVEWSDGETKPGGYREGRIVFLGGLPPEPGRVVLHFAFDPSDKDSGSVELAVSGIVQQE